MLPSGVGNIASSVSHLWCVLRDQNASNYGINQKYFRRRTLLIDHHDAGRREVEPGRRKGSERGEGGVAVFRPHSTRQPQEDGGGDASTRQRKAMPRRVDCGIHLMFDERKHWGYPGGHWHLSASRMTKSCNGGSTPRLASQARARWTCVWTSVESANDTFSGVKRRNSAHPSTTLASSAAASIACD